MEAWPISTSTKGGKVPSCRPEVLSDVIYKVMEMGPQTILDVGMGYGKWGVLCIEYLKYWKGITPLVDGVEVFEGYKSPVHKIYRNVFYLDVMRLLPRLGEYDLVLLVDVIEHLSRENGLKLLDAVKKHYIVSTPAYWSGQGACCGNEHEAHISRWWQADFENSSVIFGREGRKHILGWK